MARLLFLTTLLAAAVVCAAVDANDKTQLSVAFSCDEACEHCYEKQAAFTPGDCQVEGDFSYTATCENGAWTLKTYRGTGCTGNAVYSFGGESQTTCAAGKYTNVKIASVGSDNVKFTICPFKENKGCADSATEGCSTETIAPGECTESGNYYYTVEVNADKASIAVFSTKAECKKKVMPLTRIIEKAAEECVSYQHHVKGDCEAITTTTTTSETTSEATTTSETAGDTTTSETTSETAGDTTTTTGTTTTGTTTTGTTTTGTTTTGTTTTTDAEGDNNTTSDGVAGVTSLVAATVTAAALAMLF